MKTVEEHRQYQREYKRMRYATDPAFREKSQAKNLAVAIKRQQDPALLKRSRDYQALHRAKVKAKMEQDPAYGEEIRLRRREYRLVQRQKSGYKEKEREHNRRQWLRRRASLPPRAPVPILPESEVKVMRKEKPSYMWWASSEGLRFQHLRRRYGITIEDYEHMLADQKGLCALCGKELGKPSKGKRYHPVDHDHKKQGREAVRGIIHTKCNILLGYLEYDRELVRKAEVYLVCSELMAAV